MHYYPTGAGGSPAGYAAFGRPMRKLVIGVGMIPRGEVGLIFAQLGLSAGLLSSGLYSSVALMVMITTFVAPPTLRALLARSRQAPQDAESALCDVVTEAISDDDERRLSRAQRAATCGMGSDGRLNFGPRPRPRYFDHHRSVVASRTLAVHAHLKEGYPRLLVRGTTDAKLPTTQGRRD